MSELPPRPAPNNVAVLAPSGRDGDMIAQTLRRAQLDAAVCVTIEEFCAESRRADAGIVAEEALHRPGALEALSTALAAQPPWSDLPLVVLGIPHRTSAIELFTRLSAFANVTLLERPTRAFTLLTVTRAALRARGRQHLTREYMSELLRAREDISRHRDELQEAVSKRTEELQATSQLLRLSERMASIGALAAGLGHDMANLLLPVRADLETIGRFVPAEKAGHVMRVRKSLDYIGKLAGSMRLLALDPDGGSGEDPETDLANWWDEVRPLLQLALRKDVRLEESIEPGVAVRLAPHRLTQAVLNLVSNACDAIRAQGQPGVVRVSAVRSSEGDVVRLSVADDGPGMTEEVVRRCLEPLFTTGMHERSTGLGLSLVDGIVRAAGGRIQIESTPGAGATVTLSLPGGVGAKCAERGRPLAVVSVQDARMRGIFNTMLRIGGYVVEADVREGMSPELWVTDPTDTGLGVAATLRQRCPGVRIVVVGEPTPAWRILGARAIDITAPLSSLREAIADGQAASA